LLFESGKLDESLKYYNTVLEADPDNFRALNYKNKILKMKKGKRQYFFAKPQ
jgi:hypothetical protein